MLEIQQKDNVKNYISILQNCELFSGIEPEGILVLLGCLNWQIKKYSRDEFIFHEGKQTQVSGILISGALQIVEYDFNGNRTIISTIEPLQLFGEAYSFCNFVDKFFKVSKSVSEFLQNALCSDL